jgi:DNA-binding SARP family transcriptional activator
MSPVEHVWTAAGEVVAVDGIVLRLLGGFGLSVDGVPVDLPSPAQRTLAVAALRRLTRAQAARLLAPDADAALAMGRLRTRLWRLRHLCPDLLDENGHLLRLGARVRVDVTWLLDWARHVNAGGVTDELPFSGLGQWDLLPEHDDDWLLIDRERLRELRLHTLEHASRVLAERGRYGLALQAALAAVAEDPLRESGHRAVIEVYLAEGNVELALHRYLDVERRLREDLGVAPSPQLSRIVAENGLQWALTRVRRQRERRHRV